jgi:hypothetical protein
VIEKLPVTPAAAIAVALVFVIAIGGYFGLVAPQRRAIAQLERQLKAAERSSAGVASELPISDAERAAWARGDTDVRQRFVTPEDQHRTLVEVGQLARATGMNVRELLLQNVGALPGAPATPAPAMTLPFPMSPKLAVNPGVIRLVARHRYPDLIDFLDRVGHGNTYVAVQSLDTRRIEGYLESEIKLVSLRWTE